MTKYRPRPCSERGQAAVELLAAAPLIAVVGLLGWQLILAGHVWWKLSDAARISAREVYVANERGATETGKRRAKSAARALLGAGSAVDFGDRGIVDVSARIPLVEPFGSVLDEPRISRRAGFVR